MKIEDYSSSFNTYQIYTNYNISFPNSNTSFKKSGNYTIKLVASNTYGCSDSITSSIFVKPVTNAQFNAVPLDTCKLPANYSLVNNSTGSIAYIWDFGDGSTSNLPNLNHSLLNVIDCTITLNHVHLRAQTYHD